MQKIAESGLGPECIFTDQIRDEVQGRRISNVLAAGFNVTHDTNFFFFFENNVKNLNKIFREKTMKRSGFFFFLNNFNFILPSRR